MHACLCIRSTHRNCSLHKYICLNTSACALTIMATAKLVCGSLASRNMLGFGPRLKAHGLHHNGRMSSFKDSSFMPKTPSRSSHSTVAAASLRDQKSVRSHARGAACLDTKQELA